jgi:hypothetical protein
MESFVLLQDVCGIASRVFHFEQISSCLPVCLSYPLQLSIYILPRIRTCCLWFVECLQTAQPDNLGSTWFALWRQFVEDGQFCFGRNNCESIFLLRNWSYCHSYWEMLLLCVCRWEWRYRWARWATAVKVFIFSTKSLVLRVALWWWAILTIVLWNPSVLP